LADALLSLSGKTLFLVSEMRTRFQFIVFAGVAVEVNDLLFGFADFRHKRLTFPFLFLIWVTTLCDAQNLMWH
jgi:hypothetical protein